MLSIVIVSYKRKADLKECISAINERVFIDYEIIVVNNDFVNLGLTSEFIREYKPNANLGVAQGRNFGASKASYDNLFFIDDDAILDSDITTETLNKMTYEVPILAVISKDYFTNELRLNENVSVNSLGYCNKYVGVGHFIKTSFFKELEGYDSVSKYGMEEFNIISKMLNLNKKIKLSNIVVRHKKSDLGRDLSFESKVKLGKSKISYISKNTPAEIIVINFLFWTFYCFAKSKNFLPISLLINNLKSKKDSRFNRLNFYKTSMQTNTNIFY